MLPWISENHGVIDIAINLVTAGVWIFYLQILVVGFRRQRRSNILINRSAGSDDRAHCVVGNMGAEPIYVTSVIVDLAFEDGVRSAVVTERDDIPDDSVTSALERTKQGPLESGQSRDLGSITDILKTALGHLDLERRLDEVNSVTLTVAAATGHDTYLAAGEQTFFVAVQGERHVYLPTSTLTKQVRSASERRRLRRRLDKVLTDEAKQFQREDAFDRTRTSLKTN